MNLPLRALYEIRAFSQPMTRVDWRTCKRNEIRTIKVQISLSKLGKKMWPALERKLHSDEADRVIRLLTAYAEAAAAAEEAAKRNLAAEYHAACEEFRKRAIRFGRSLQRNP
jgi:vacuolar-type H+-ATPase subunit B/Vma2